VGGAYGEATTVTLEGDKSRHVLRRWKVGKADIAHRLNVNPTMGTSGHKPTPKLVLNVVVVHAAIDNEISAAILKGETQVIDMPMRVCHPSSSERHVELWLGYHKETGVCVISESVPIIGFRSRKILQRSFRVAN
jgi:hypothetical protein